MTVIIKQRTPDLHTKEQHTYTLYDVAMVTTTHDGFGGHYIKVVGNNGRQNTYSLYVFDLEIHKI